MLGGYADDAAVETQILKVGIASYSSLRESMSLRDELVENEQTCYNEPTCTCKADVDSRARSSAARLRKQAARALLVQAAGPTRSQPGPVLVRQTAFPDL